MANILSVLKNKIIGALLLTLLSKSIFAQVNVVVLGVVANPAWLADVQTRLQATGSFTSVSTFLLNTGTPTVTYLQGFQAVLLFTDFGALDPITTGNNLATYIDGGGAVVSCAFDNASVPLLGNFNTPTYRVVNSAPLGNTPGMTLGTVFFPGHPVLTGITNLDNGSIGWSSSSTSFVAGTAVLANWSNGAWLAAVRTGVGPALTRRCDLNIFPPSSDARSDFWVSTTQGTELMRNALLWVAPPPASALNFDGVDDFVSVANSPSLNISSAISLEAWVYATKNTGTQDIMCKSDCPTSNTGYIFPRTDNGWASCAVYMFLAGNWRTLTVPYPGLNQWVHLAATYDGSNMRIYVNGILAGTSPVYTGGIFVNANTLTIGNQPGCGGEYFGGSVDECRIWNRALCQEEIQNNMNCEIPSNSSGLIANWHFNQGFAGAANLAVTNLVDASSSANTGILNGFVLNGTTSNWVAPGGITTGSSCAAFVPPVSLVSPISQTNIACFGGNNGAATVTASGGSGLTYNWTPGNPTGDGTASVTGLTAGTWTCTITNNCGGTATQTFNITAPSALAASSSATAISCNGGNATITVVGAGGIAPYTGTGTFTVTAGTYSYIVTDANGCTNTTSITVTEPTALAAAATATAISCNGGNATVTVVGAGGTSPYTGTGTFTVTAGTYTYVVTDANGCTNTTSITVTEPTALTAAATATSISCNGGNATVTVVGAGGTAPYTGEGSFTVTAGTYSYTVTDANNCTTTTSITVTEPTAISTSVVSVNVGCNGDSTGSIDLTVTGGTGPYTFDWNSGTYTTEDLTGLAAGTYVGVLTDANGCADSGTITITQPAVLIATVTTIVDPSSCGAFDGSIDITVSGGTMGYTYLWNTNVTTEDLTGVGAGAYSCVVTDTNGCTANVSGNLNDPNAPTVTLALAVDTLCSTDAAFTLTGESPAGGTFSGPGITGNSFDPAAAGTGMHMISYTYMDINGCSGSTTDSIFVDVCTGTPVSGLGSQFSIFPNPNNGIFTVLAESNCMLSIYDITGKLIYSSKTTNAKNEIDLTAFANGVYVLKVEIGNNVNTQKVVLNQ